MENRICVEKDGMQLWIPESKLEAWQKADHKAPLSEEEKKMRDAIVKRIFGDSGQRKRTGESQNTEI